MGRAAGAVGTVHARAVVEAPRREALAARVPRDARDACASLAGARVRELVLLRRGALRHLATRSPVAASPGIGPRPLSPVYISHLCNALIQNTNYRH